MPGSWQSLLSGTVSRIPVSCNLPCLEKCRYWGYLGVKNPWCLGYGGVVFGLIIPFFLQTSSHCYTSFQEIINTKLWIYYLLCKYIWFVFHKFSKIHYFWLTTPSPSCRAVVAKLSKLREKLLKLKIALGNLFKEQERPFDEKTINEYSAKVPLSSVFRFWPPKNSVKTCRDTTLTINQTVD